MKIVAIGDIHGRHLWAEIVAKEELTADMIVFVGDYFDTYAKISAEQQIENFNLILEYKRQFPDKVVMLIGNHDFHYMVSGETYSGYQEQDAEAIRKALLDAMSTGDIQAAYEHDGFLFTHAGVTKTWCLENGIDVANVVEEANLVFEHNKSAYRFNRKDQSGYGESIWQSPFWVRPRSLLTDKIPGFIQIVGHTTQEDGIDLTIDDGVVLVDALGVREYLIIQDNVPSVGSV